MIGVTTIRLSVPRPGPPPPPPRRRWGGCGVLTAGILYLSNMAGCGDKGALCGDWVELETCEDDDGSGHSVYSDDTAEACRDDCHHDGVTLPTGYVLDNSSYACENPGAVLTNYSVNLPTFVALADPGGFPFVTDNSSNAAAESDIFSTDGSSVYSGDFGVALDGYLTDAFGGSSGINLGLTPTGTAFYEELDLNGEQTVYLSQSYNSTTSAAGGTVCHEEDSTNTCEHHECDIVIYAQYLKDGETSTVGYFQYTIDENAESGFISLALMLQHELGHTLGLDENGVFEEPCTSTSGADYASFDETTMFTIDKGAVLKDGADYCRPSNDDIQALKHIYGG